MVGYGSIKRSSMKSVGDNTQGLASAASPTIVNTLAKESISRTGNQSIKHQPNCNIHHDIKRNQLHFSQQKNSPIFSQANPRLMSYGAPKSGLVP